MSIISILVALVVVGLVLWVVSTIPMDATIKRIIHVIVVALVIVWLLQAFGLLGGHAIRL